MQLLSAAYCARLCALIADKFPDADMIASELDLVRHFPSLYITLGTVHESPNHSSHFDGLPPIYLSAPPPRHVGFCLALDGICAGHLEPFLIDATVRIIGQFKIKPANRPQLILSE